MKEGWLAGRPAGRRRSRLEKKAEAKENNKNWKRGKRGKRNYRAMISDNYYNQRDKKDRDEGKANNREIYTILIIIIHHIKRSTRERLKIWLKNAKGSYSLRIHIS